MDEEASSYVPLPTEYILSPEGAEQSVFSHAIYLLNKVIPSTSYKNPPGESGCTEQQGQTEEHTSTLTTEWP